MQEILNCLDFPINAFKNLTIQARKAGKMF